MKWLFLLLGVWLCSCTSQPKSADTVLHVTLLRGPSALVFARWMEEPPTLAGKQVEIELVDSPERMQASLIKGESDLAVLPMISAANLYNKGIGYRLVGCPIWGTLYLVGRPGSLQQASPTVHIFGAGTTPDILTRHYLQQQALTCTPNYTLSTPGEIVQGFRAGRVEVAVLSEPFVSYALRTEPLQLLGDLNRLEPEGSEAFPQTAILLRDGVQLERTTLDRLLEEACRYVNLHPQAAVATLEEQQLFPPHWLDAAGVERCRIHYRPASEAAEAIRRFLQLILDYEPQALGQQMPDDDFFR
ncbi:MAG: ABC transporter substrate-binding protein [Parabacteroides sp.]